MRDHAGMELDQGKPSRFGHRLGTKTDSLFTLWPARLGRISPLKKSKASSYLKG